MRVFHDYQAFPTPANGVALTIGKFDGVHHGHQHILNRLMREARLGSLDAVAFTFDRNPVEVFAPERTPEALCSTSQKLEMFERSGVPDAIVQPFTKDFAALSPLAFIREVIHTALNTRVLIVGRDFRFGAGGAGDVALLHEHAAEFGFTVIVPDDEAGPEGRRVSSSWVREMIAAGDVRTAAAVLGHAHEVRGLVVHGAKRGRELGFPTANLGPDTLEGMVPADGVYACWFDDGETIRMAAVSVGNNPTFEGVPERQVEAHVLDADLDLYGKTVRIAFVERLRGNIAYEGREALIAAITLDVAHAREVLAASPRPRI